MATKKQIEANRKNAKQSTGPKTAAGKARSRLNAVKHGLTSRLPVLADEDTAQFREFRMEVSRDLRPGSTVETALVVRIAAVQWRLARIPGLEAELIESARYEPGGRDVGVGEAWARASEHIARLQRYEASLERSLSRLLKELRALQSRREGREAEEVREQEAAYRERRYALPKPPPGGHLDAPDRVWGELPAGEGAALPPPPRAALPAPGGERPQGGGQA